MVEPTGAVYVVVHAALLRYDDDAGAPGLEWEYQMPGSDVLPPRKGAVLTQLEPVGTTMFGPATGGTVGKGDGVPLSVRGGVRVPDTVGDTVTVGVSVPVGLDPAVGMGVKVPDSVGVFVGEGELKREQIRLTDPGGPLLAAAPCAPPTVPAVAYVKDVTEPDTQEEPPPPGEPT
jgi:hypothetical protein